METHRPGDEWCTPQWLFEWVRARWSVTIDLASSSTNALLPDHLDRERDALSVPWASLTERGHRWGWCNPPYSAIDPWVEKAREGAEAPGKRQRLIGFAPYYVFSGDQIENMPPPEGMEATARWEPHELIERLIAESGIEVVHAWQDRAFYRPNEDRIHMPERAQFDDESSYYATLLHEWYHATGHASREARAFGLDRGDPRYALEELRAEIFSLMAAQALGLPYELGSHAAYVASWRQAVDDDPKTVVSAALEASRMLDAVMDFAATQRFEPPWRPSEAQATMGAAP